MIFLITSAKTKMSDFLDNIAKYLPILKPNVSVDL